MNVFRALTGRFQRTGSASRRHVRHECFVASRLHFLDQGFHIDGFINEISQGGIRFRCEQNFIMLRTNEIVRIGTESHEYEGILRNTSTDGYGIQLRHPLDEASLAAFLVENPPRPLAA